MHGVGVCPNLMWMLDWLWLRLMRVGTGCGVEDKSASREDQVIKTEGVFAKKQALTYICWCLRALHVQPWAMAAAAAGVAAALSPKGPAPVAAALHSKLS